MQFTGRAAALCLAACASILPATSAASTQHRAPSGARQTVPEVRTRDLLLFAAGLILLAGRRRPGHDKWQHEQSRQDDVQHDAPRQGPPALQQQ
ncbi:hypothetical protein [Janthinobacterium sp. AD80]|uniref:hypothetical protein n=1 Tax=Janthinobacterium sp. AD80 TaxID=1528773 RepID=UPI000C843FB9|nr:hypothetical protein [Janthinobacterium sp. AD80]